MTGKLHWTYMYEQYFTVVQYVMLYNVIKAFVLVDEILFCDHSDLISSVHFPAQLFVILHKGVCSF